MTFGSPEILECPSCHTTVRYVPLASGNTFGATIWSDGKAVSPMMPEQPGITRCRQCSSFWWLHKATKSDKPLVRFYQFWKRRPPAPLFLTALEYLDAIEGGAAESREEEAFLRTRAWWTANDRFRGTDSEKLTSAKPDVRGTANMEVLVNLLGESDPNEIFTRVELFRQLGKMKEASQMLERAFPEEYNEVVTQLAEWIDAGDRQVRRFKFKEAEAPDEEAMAVESQKEQEQLEQRQAACRQAVETVRARA